jgi:arabinogalactan oligomer/maltooligosaccharide transport system permease protein
MTEKKLTMSKWLRDNLWRHAAALGMCIFALFPLYLVVISSLNPTGSLQLTSFIPREISWNNYKLLFDSPAIPFLSWFKNSLIIASAVAIFSVFIGASSAFAFSRLRFKGRKQGVQILLLVQMFPAILALSAVYVIMERVYKFAPNLGLGSQAGLLLVYLGGAMGVNIWLLKGFVDSIPVELDEAAKIDGASPMQIYWLIFIPLARPVLAVVALLSFIGTLNEYILARLFLVEMDSRTVAVGLQQFIAGQYSQNWGPFAAGSILLSVPIVAIFLSLQRYIVSGLTAGSVKG